MKSIVAAVLFAIVSVAMAAEICRCPDIYKPVCDSDLQTHANLCDFECEQRKDESLFLLHEGPCVIEDLCVCYLLYEPVCGSDGITYGNKCMFECNSSIFPFLYIVHDGPC